MTSVMLDKNGQRVQILAEKLRYLFTLPTWNTFPVLRSLISDDWLWGKNWRSEQFCTVSGFRQTSVKNAQKKSWRILWLWKNLRIRDRRLLPSQTEAVSWQPGNRGNPMTIQLGNGHQIRLYFFHQLYFSYFTICISLSLATMEIQQQRQHSWASNQTVVGRTVHSCLVTLSWEIMTFLSCITCELTSQYSSISTLRSIRGQRKGHGKDLGSHFRTSSCFVELYQVPFNYVMSGHIKEFWQILFWLMRLFTEDS